MCNDEKPKYVASDDEISDIMENQDTNQPVEDNEDKTPSCNVSEVDVSNPEKDLEEDYQYIRDNLRTITDTSMDALQNLYEVATNSQHPRVYEVLSMMVRSIADAQKDLLSIHKDKTKIEKDRNKPSGPGVVNNNLFVGTAAQLDELIAKMKPKKNVN